MAYRQRFTPQNPPRSGDARRLWRWWVARTGQPPDELWVLCPGRHERAAGAAHYVFVSHLVDYLVWDVDETLATTPDACTERSRSDVVRDPRTGQYALR